MLLFTILSFLLYLPRVWAAWGYTDTGSTYVIDTGASLVVTVSKTNGDITSLLYNGVEYQGYSGKNTQVESGLGASTVTITSYSSPAYIIKVSVTYGTMHHYLVFRYGNANVYILTNKADDSVTATRYIVRIPGGTFTHSVTESDFYDDGDTYIEAEDIMVDSANGYTKSKHYQGSNYGRTMDYDYIGRSNSKVGMWMIRSNHEKASGGPFFRSLLRRADTTGEDLYDIYYYNMGITDPERFGLQGPSVLAFTAGGATPNTALFARNADWSWFDTLGLVGWTTWADRGYVSGVGISGLKSGFTYTVGLSNSAAQYWGAAAASTGAFTIKNVIAGTYTLTVYKNELAVYTGSVTVSVGAGTAVHTLTLTDPSDTTAVWRIGDWDGTPAGFLNFGSTPYPPTYMHPSDSRISSWDVGNFIVGTTATSSFPSYIWADVNNGHVIYFKLTAAQYAAAHTLRIGITQAYINGRPQVTVNSWTSSIPSASSQASTRSLTVGTYRGNNVVFEYTIPATAWLQSTSEWQVLTINVVSGSTGSGYLSAGISLDCVELI